MDLDASGHRELSDEKPDRARAEDQQALTRLEPGRVHGPDRTTSGLDQGRCRGRDLLGNLIECRGRNGQLLSQSTRPAPANPDLMTEFADVVSSAATPVTFPATEHGVASDPLSQPGWVHSLAESSHPANPFVTDSKRIGLITLTEIVHLTCEELDIGSTYPSPFDLDYDETCLRGGRSYIFDPSHSGAMENQCSHPPSIPSPSELCRPLVTVLIVGQRMSTDQMRGLSDLFDLVVDRLTAPVEGMHRAIADRSLRWTGPGGEPARRVFDATIASVYDVIRFGSSAVGATIGLAASSRGEALAETPLNRKVRAAINATWGDELVRREIDFQIEMGIRQPGGALVELTPAGVAAGFPSATSRIVVLVHGLGRTEDSWLEKDDRPGLRDRLVTESPATPVMVRYNTGRHVSDNGAELAQLLEQLFRCWPTPIESMALVGHSMGGLVIRSACLIGNEAGKDWTKRLDHVITVATPHLGAPLEKAANIVAWALGATAESRPLAEFLDARSVGIKDLRFGRIVEGGPPGTDVHNDPPPLPEVEQHFVAAVVTKNPRHPVGAIFGDLMVRAASGTGRGRRRTIEANDTQVLGGRKHFDLLHDYEIQDQIIEWLGLTKPSSET